MGRPKRGAAAKSEASEDTKKAKGGLAVGDNLPEFELETDTEQTVSSADMVRRLPRLPVKAFCSV